MRAANTIPKYMTETNPQSQSKHSAGMSMKNLRSVIAASLACVAAFSLAILLPSLALAQSGTLMPAVPFTAMDSNGDPISAGKLCTYLAGTTTPASTYTSSALSTPNTNPVIMDSAGRAVVYLTPGVSYKFLLLTAGTDTTCATGATVWTQDNVAAVPASASSLDVLGTVGETVTAGQAVYLSDGSGGLTSGSWYKADADNSYSSTSAVVGVVPAGLTISTAGTIRLGGVVTGLSSLTAGLPYYVGATAGALVTSLTGVANVRLVGVASGATSLIVVGAKPEADLSSLYRPLCQGRLTLETGVPVSTTDQSAKATLYWTPYLGNSVGLYNGTTWVMRSFIELSLSLVGYTASKPYDIFVYDNAGTAALESLIWTSATARATALTTQDGVLVKTGATTRRYLGTIYINGSGAQTDDTAEKRYVFNHYNRSWRPLARYDSTASWAMGTAWRSANNAAANAVQVMVGWPDCSMRLTATLNAATGNSAGTVGFATAIGEDVTNGPLAAGVMNGVVVGAATSITVASVAIHAIERQPALGLHVYNWLEFSVAGDTAYGNQSGIYHKIRSGLSGSVEQ